MEKNGKNGDREDLWVSGMAWDKRVKVAQAQERALLGTEPYVPPNPPLDESSYQT